MRKQTKLVAVLSTAALLAVGASMSSFAAQGWQEENGTWVYYDKSGDLETEKWEKSGDNWFYLNEDGEMATDAIIEYDDNYYYVDENGAMVTNKWVSVENEDYGDDDSEPANHWYYFGSNGKAYKTSDTSTSASFKTINGKKYIFDDEGKMLYGWINADGERETTEEDEWQNGVYYCGDENDGAQAIGWVSIEITDNDYEEAMKGGSSKNVFDDENQTRWFYFKSNGKKMVDEKGKTINGKKYSFDKYGRMNAEWVNWEATPSTASQAEIKDENGNVINRSAIATNTKAFRYYGSPEDGARVTKGWFQVVPDSYLNESDYDDDETNWYYSDKDGKLIASEIKTINGKKYAFDHYGAMQDGLRAIKLVEGSSTKIEDIKKSDKIPGKHFDTEDDFKDNMSDIYDDLGYRIYFFGTSDDGSMKTGKQTVSIDGESYSFLFNKSGSSKGQGKFGIDDDKYYLGGMLMKADKDDKYSVLKITKDGDKFKEIKMLSTEQFLADLGATSEIPEGKDKDYDEYYDVEVAAADKTIGDDTTIQYRLVNTSGTVQKGKSKAKDGDDRCFEVKSNKEIKRVFVES